MGYRQFFFIFLVLIFHGCKTEQYQSTEVNGERIPIETSIPEDTAIANFIKPFSEHINKTLDSVLAYNPQDLNKSEGELNTAIGNLMADIVMEQANPVFKSRTGEDIDMVLLNHGGIRSSIGKGPITARTAYSVMPFENEIVVAELKGEKILDMISYLENNRTPHPVSGIILKVNTNNKITSATINDNEIDPDQTYYVATSDYLQQGGDNMNFFQDPVNLFVIDYKIRNAMIDYFQKVDTIHTAIDDRYIKLD